MKTKQDATDKPMYDLILIVIKELKRKDRLRFEMLEKMKFNADCHLDIPEIDSHSQSTLPPRLNHNLDKLKP